MSLLVINSDSAHCHDPHDQYDVWIGCIHGRHHGLTLINCPMREGEGNKYTSMGHVHVYIYISLHDRLVMKCVNDVR